MSAVRRAAKKRADKLVALHVRIPEDLFEKLLAKRDAMRSEDPMANLSGAVRAVLERALR